jgi:uncharacterized membrane protein YraQ (UPF0718 family)
MDKIRIIEKSLRCFALSFFSLVPVFGIASVVATFVRKRKIMREVGDGWNPAHNYLKWATIVALLGTLLSLPLSAVLLVVISVITSGLKY